MNESRQELTRIAKAWANDWFSTLVDHDLSEPSPDKCHTFEEVISDHLTEARESYASNALGKAKRTAQSLLSEPDNHSESDFKYLCQQVLKQTINALELLHSKHTKDTPLPDELHPEEVIRPTTSKRTSSVKVSEAFEKYVNEKTKSEAWNRQRSINENKFAVSVFIETMGDMNLTDIDKEVARNFKEKLMNYPLNRTKSPVLKDLPIESIYAGEVEYQTISMKTVENRFVKIAAFFNWAEANGYMDTNPMRGMNVKSKKRKKDERLPFTESELKTIFTTDIYTKNRHLHDHYYWLPLLGLFTGARIEELCQLYLSDLTESDGILCFNITDDGEGQQLKNEASKRMLPVHSKLMELGFAEYINARKESGETMLFPAMKKRSERYSHDTSKWFGRYKQTLGITDKRKVFHSFRHTLADKLRSYRTEDYSIKSIMGHTDESATHGTYGSVQDVKTLKTVIEQMCWNDALSEVVPFKAH